MSLDYPRVLEERGLTQVGAEEVLGVNQARGVGVSALKGYKLEGFQGGAVDALRYGAGA